MISEAGTRIRTGDLLITKASDKHNLTHRGTAIRSVAGGLDEVPNRSPPPPPHQTVPFYLFCWEDIASQLRGALEAAASHDRPTLLHQLTAILRAVGGER
jgi:hypothetical protein